jgi:hypothetical protein
MRDYSASEAWIVGVTGSTTKVSTTDIECHDLYLQKVSLYKTLDREKGEDLALNYSLNFQNANDIVLKSPVNALKERTRANFY